MNHTVKNITIVGGGSAGWLTAGIIAAEHIASDTPIKITLIESPDIKPIGVGEGTWPSMRNSLKKIGISEREFIQCCDASFKQGSQFISWQNDNNNYYFHPFSLPNKFNEINLAQHWLKYKDQVSFAHAVTVQSHLCEHNLAPKQIATPEYAFHANYGYHLDASKFSQLLQKHCINTLNVVHVQDQVLQVNSAENGDISSVSTQHHGNIDGDFFIDCSGAKSLLLAEHYKIPLICKKEILFNDSAIAAQVPYPEENSPINSCTLSTAHQAGWIWDIGLQSRRGIGNVYSSAHCTEPKAEKTLRQYIALIIGEKQADNIELRKISFQPGHRAKLWHKNCVAIGMASGFIEPLEASALALVELSAQMIAEQLPANRKVMDIVARRFNQKFLQHWQRIIDFLKLHYALSNRSDSDYWLDNRAKNTIPESLQELLELWRYQVPSHHDITHTEELFPAASFQFIYYGMGGVTAQRYSKTFRERAAQAEHLFHENSMKTKQLMASLNNNRELLNKVKQFGFSKI